MIKVTTATKPTQTKMVHKLGSVSFLGALSVELLNVDTVDR